MPLLKSIARVSLHRAGGLRLLRSLNRRGLRVLMFHGFQPDDARALDRRCAWLRRNFHPVSMADVALARAGGPPLPPSAVAITVDDGYRDFYEVAYPVFSAHCLPVTVYVVTGFIDGCLWLWTDQVQYLAAHARSKSVELAVAGERRVLPLGTSGEKECAAVALTEALKSMPDSERRRFLLDLPRLVGAGLPRDPPPQYAPLTWDSARRMSANGIEFGAHTVTHPILSRLADETALREEIEGSRRRIEEELQSPVLHFCYPNGRPVDVSDAAADCVRNARFATAVTTQQGFNFPGADVFRLKRIPADPAYSDAFFAEYMAGARVR